MNHMKRAAVVLAVLQAGLSWAQSNPPDAGSLMQQVPRPEPLSRPAPVAPSEATPAPTRRAPGQQVMVRSIRFVGNSRLSEAQLAPLVAPYLNRSVDLAQLEDAAIAVAQRYREEGWVVAVYLPSQDITRGDVLIQIDEARLGVLQFSAPEGLRAPQALAQRYFDELLVSGQALNAGDVDRAQHISSELLGLDVSTRFKKSQAVGATDVDVGLRDKPLVAMDLWADNGGARSTGNERVLAQIELRNPLATGDIWNLALMKSQGSDNARLGLGVPVGPHGWRVGGSVSRFNYRLVKGEVADSVRDPVGHVNSVGLEAAYPLLRERQRSLSLTLSTDHKAFENRAAGQINSRYSSQVASVTLSGRQRDEWLGLGGQTQGLLALSAGRLNLNGSPTQAGDAQGARTDGQFSKLRAQLSRAQSLAPGWTLLLSHSQQWANTNLDSSEKFYIGGPDSVRAFPVNEASGARGSLSSAELQWQLSGTLALLGFYDQGRVRVNVDPYDGAAQPNRLRLEGAGLGLQWRPDASFSLKASWARRLQDNPNPRDGKDQDGTLRRDRLWLSAIYSF